MVHKLFVYGTLQPGQPNDHILKNIGGNWEPASVKGTLHQVGWGAAMGYPAITLDKKAGIVEGYLFTSGKLEEKWVLLDEFEGTGYRRIITTVKLINDEQVDAYIYVLNN